MRYRPLGNSGHEVSVIGLGTWNLERAKEDVAIRALRHGIELGMNHIDTAEMYGSGSVESIVGRAIADCRDKVFLTTKVLPSNASFKGTLSACESSLSRLGTDRIDLYLLHWPSRHPMAETVRAFQSLKEAGKIRAFGVSNFDAGALMEFLTAAPPNSVACNQVLYHLEERAIEHEVLPTCRRQGVGVVGYSPFGSGGFPRPDGERGARLAAIAQELGVSSRRLALAFLCRDEWVSLIPKSATLSHVEDNAQAAELVLDRDVLVRLDKIFPRGRPKPLPVI